MSMPAGDVGPAVGFGDKPGSGDKPALRRMPFRGGGFVATPRTWAPWVFFALVIASWQVAVDLGVLDAMFLPSPRSIAGALYGIAAGGELREHLAQSLGRLALGWSIGTAAGLVAGFAMGLSSLMRAVSLATVSAFFPIPKIALLPLFILWLGIGEASKVATIALGVFFPTTIATFSSIDGVPRNLIRMAQSFNVPPLAILRKIVFPGALPGILAGFRITTSIALLLLVAAEMIGAEHGIGAFIVFAGNVMLTDQLLAGVVILSVLGLTFNAILTAIERRFLRWR
jgi:ABC-type nitrate/sulfonate/bicarbonate transport system permease component